MGCFAYVSQVSMTPAQLDALPAEQAALWRAMPAWATGAYAVAVWLSLLAGVLLVLRRALAAPLFAVALIAVAIQFGWVFFGSGELGDALGGSDLVFPLVIIAIQIALLWFAWSARTRGWLR